jgi:hypothetical protein
MSRWRSRRGTGGAETYLFVADAAAHCERAKAAGADILLDIDDTHSNGRGYSCRDIEGHVWNFGAYDPWKRQASRFAERGRKLRRLTMAIASLVAATAAVVALGWGAGCRRLKGRSIIA